MPGELRDMEDQRHAEDGRTNVMAYQTADGELEVEMKGLLHHVQGWYEQGNPKVSCKIIFVQRIQITSTRMV